MKEMTVGELMDKIEGWAGDYCQEAVGLLKTHSKYYRLKKKDLRIGKKSTRRIVEAILADFINYIARGHGGNRGERVEHLAEAFMKNEEARAEERKEKQLREEKKNKKE